MGAPMLELSRPSMLPKAPTGISGFDDITQGGLPTGRPTLFCGGPGCGKTLFGITFLVNGATRFGEPGVFMSFEERGVDLAANVASLGYDLDGLIAEGKLAIDHVWLERSEIDENGEYDLEGLFIRLGCAVESIGAKRVVVDTIEALFSCFANPALLRSELRRLFGWLKDRGLTAIITGERGEGDHLTRQGLEEYVSDCVIFLDNRVMDQVTTRRMRVVKYRGSAHGTNEYPFLIDDKGINVLPATSSRNNWPASSEIIPTGIASLDATLGRGGFYRGSSILLSGGSGSGKTTIGCHFVDAACARGERCQFFGFEESTEEICRNGHSIGLDLQKWVDSGRLRFEAVRPNLYGLEMHLARMHRDLDEFRPDVVVIDPISALRGPSPEIYATLLGMVHLLKSPRDHGAVHQPAHRRDAGEQPGAGLVLDDGHLDQADGHRGECRAQPCSLRHQGPGHEPFQSGARVPNDGCRVGTDRRLCRSRRCPDRYRAAHPGRPREGRRHEPAAGSGASPPRSRPSP